MSDARSFTTRILVGVIGLVCFSSAPSRLVIALSREATPPELASLAAEKELMEQLACVAANDVRVKGEGQLRYREATTAANEWLDAARQEAEADKRLTGGLSESLTQAIRRVGRSRLEFVNFMIDNLDTADIGKCDIPDTLTRFRDCHPMKHHDLARCAALRDQPYAQVSGWMRSEADQAKNAVERDKIVAASVRAVRNSLWRPLK